jgi:ferredoxin
MPYVVTGLCQTCKFTDCVAVCPTNCFHEAEKMLVINPFHCINCDACAAECPAKAIYARDDVPDQWHDYIALNAELAPRLPPITERKPRSDQS